MRYRALDAVRGLAALSVVVHHCILSLPQDVQDRIERLLKFTPLRPFSTGRPFVLLFFVLSGFVLTVAIRSDRRFSYGAFVLKRFCRIYLPYAASLAFSIVVFVLVHPAPMPELTSWFNSTWADGISMDAVAENALLVGTYYSASLNNVNWSLVYELRISILFPFLVEAIAAFGIPGVLGGTLLLSVACDMLLFLLGTGPTPYFEATLPKALLATFHFVVFFALGAGLAVEIQKSESRLRALDPLLVKLLCVVAVIGGMASIDLVNAAGATALIVICLVMPKLSAWLDRPLPQFLGRISFSLYLVHLPILVGLTHLLYGLVDQFAIIALAIALSLVTATLAYEAVERPAVRAGRVLSRRMTGETPG